MSIIESKSSDKNTPFLKRIRRYLLAVTVTFFVGFVVALFIHHSVQKNAEGKIYTVGEAPSRRVAIVFGARVFSDGDVCYPLKVRLTAALELYKSGKVEKILVSGDNRWQNYNEPEVMREWLVARGAAVDDVVCDYAGRRTLDTCARARKLWNLQKAVLVTQRYHLPRALYLAEAWGIDVVGVAADGMERQTAARRDLAREVLASVKAWLDVNVLDTQPALLGKSETI